MKVTLDMSDFHAGLKSLGTKYPMAVRRALKRSATAGQTEMVKAIGADTGIQAKRIKADIRISELGDTGIQIEIKGNRLPLLEFKAKGPEPSYGRGRGVSYKLTGGKGRDPHAFIATMRSGHRGVFKRMEAASSRLPIT